MSERARLYRILVASAALLIAGCTSFPVNPPLSGIDTKGGYRFGLSKAEAPNSNETFVILTLSGGGTRAAALAPSPWLMRPDSTRWVGRGTFVWTHSS